MAKKVYFKLRDIASQTNGNYAPGSVVPNTYEQEAKWYTSEQVQYEYRKYYNDQSGFSFDSRGRYFLTITAIKTVEACECCNGDGTTEEIKELI